jgi:TrmH family RNA methyltransferase
LLSFTEITSPSNPKVKEAVKLRDGKHRRRTGLFLIDGEREIRRAVQSGIEIVLLFGDEPSLAAFAEAGKLFTENVFQVPPPILDKMGFGERESLVAVAKTPQTPLHTFERMLDDCPLIAVLEGIEKPGNIGAVFRSADGAGLNGVVLADPRTDLYNPAVIRNSMGTLFKMPAAVAGAEEVLAFFREHRIHIAAARCEAAVPYTDYDFRQPTAIVLGNEADGLTEHWQGEGITAISLPMLGIADSLNISNAAAVLFYEARRQQNTKKNGNEI